MSTKAELRSEHFLARAAIAPLERTAKDQAIRKRVLALPEIHRAQTVFSYVSLPDEVETAVLLQDLLVLKKTVAIPRTNAETKTLSFHSISLLDSLQPGYRGILEPPDESPEVSLAQADVMLVPGVAFDAAGARIGQGGGYYDRVLAAAGQQTSYIGLAYGCQVVDVIKTEAHDVPVHQIITETRVISCQKT